MAFSSFVVIVPYPILSGPPPLMTPSTVTVLPAVADTPPPTAPTVIGLAGTAVSSKVPGVVGVNVAAVEENAGGTAQRQSLGNCGGIAKNCQSAVEVGREVKSGGAGAVELDCTRAGLSISARMAGGRANTAIDNKSAQSVILKHSHINGGSFTSEHRCSWPAGVLNQDTVGTDVGSNRIAPGSSTLPLFKMIWSMLLPPNPVPAKEPPVGLLKRREATAVLLLIRISPAFDTSKLTVEPSEGKDSPPELGRERESSDRRAADNDAAGRCCEVGDLSVGLSDDCKRNNAAVIHQNAARAGKVSVLPTVIVPVAGTGVRFKPSVEVAGPMNSTKSPRFVLALSMLIVPRAKVGRRAPPELSVTWTVDSPDVTKVGPLVAVLANVCELARWRSH